MAKKSVDNRQSSPMRPKGPKIKVAASASVSKNQAKTERESLSSVRNSVVFLAAVAVAYTLYLVLSGQMGEFLLSLGGVQKRWVLAGVLVYVIYYVLGVSAYVVAVVTDKESPVGIRDLMSVEASGIFFSNLTPNGTGGTPAQVFRLTRAGLSVGGAGALQYTRFIVYEAGEGIFAALMLLLRYDYFVGTYGNVFVIGALLFGFKIIEVAGLVAVCLFPKLAIVVGNTGLSLLRRLGFVKRYDHWHEVVNTQILEFSTGFKVASTNLGGMLLTTCITLVQLGCLYALPFFVLNAFGKEADLLTCLACGSMLELLTSAIPLPGGTGGAEGGFAFLFGGMFGSEIAAGYVIWRMLEYFLPILAAVPLLGLRSYGNGTLYIRWQRAKRRLRRLANRGLDRLRWGTKGSGKGGGGSTDVGQTHAGEIRIPMGHKKGRR